MSYDVRFRKPLGGGRSFKYVGDDWLNHTANTGTMIKEVCGSRPPEWSGRSCKEMYPTIVQGVSLLTVFPQKYKCFEPQNGWGTVETTRAFLEKIVDTCEKYPDAIIEVTV